VQYVQWVEPVFASIFDIFSLVLDKSLSFWYCLIFLRNVGEEFDPLDVLEAAKRL
jgi:hypothetical protein